MPVTVPYAERYDPNGELLPITEVEEGDALSLLSELVPEVNIETQHNSLSSQPFDTTAFQIAEAFAAAALRKDIELQLDRNEDMSDVRRPSGLYEYDREADRTAAIDFIRSTEFPKGVDYDYDADLDLDFELASTPFHEPEAELRAGVSDVSKPVVFDPYHPNAPLKSFVSCGQTPPPLALLRAQKQQMKRALAIREGNNFKGQYAHKTSLARASIAKEGPLNKLARYYMQGGNQAKAQGQVLEALANLYDIMLRRPNHELILKLGGYSPVVGHLIYATLMHNPNTLLG